MRRSIFSIGFFLLTVVAGCSSSSESQPEQIPSAPAGTPFEFKKQKVSALLEPLETPVPVQKKTKFRLKFWQSGQGNVDGPYTHPGLTPHIWLWMPMPQGSHGSAPVTVLSALDDQGQEMTGVFDAKNVVFTMAGDWEIHVELKQSDGTVVDDFIQTIHI